MDSNPYKFEIIIINLIGPLVIGIEIWRRWMDFLNPAFWDDPIVFIPAMIASYLIYKRIRFGQYLWLFCCGMATAFIFYSFTHSIMHLNTSDVSGVSMPIVAVLKGIGVIGVIIGVIRAFKIVSFDLSKDIDKTHNL